MQKLNPTLVGLWFVAPNPFRGPTQRFIHTVEILTQNGSLGIMAVLLLRRRSAR